MPLATYADLQASIARWLDRDDLAAVIPDFITLAEARLNDRLRLAPMEIRLTVLPAEAASSHGSALIDPHTGAILTDPHTGAFIVIGNGAGPTISTVTLPNDFLEMRRAAALTSPSRSIRLADPGWVADTYLGRVCSAPDFYTITGSTLTVYPASTTLLTLDYYRRIPTLSDAAPTNWLLTGRPNLYLYAALLEASPYMMDDDRAVGWAKLLDEAITNAQMADAMGRWSNAGMRIGGPTP